MKPKLHYLIQKSDAFKILIKLFISQIRRKVLFLNCRELGIRYAAILVFSIFFVPLCLAQLNIDGTQSQSSPFKFSDLTTSEKLQAADGIIIWYLQEMTLDTNLVMNQGTTIVVKKGNAWHIPAHYGGILHIKANISSSGTNTWEGIQVEGMGADLSHFYNRPDTLQMNDSSEFYGLLYGTHGRVSLYEHAVIEKAHIGIKSEWGGIVESMDVNNIKLSVNKPKFINCETGIQIGHHWADPAQSANRIMGVHFEWNDHTLWDHVNLGNDYSIDAYAHIRLIDAKGVYIGGCTFICNDPLKYDPESRGIGVRLVNYNPDHKPSFVIGEMGNVFHTNTSTGCIDVKVENEYSTTYGGTFENLTYGIFTDASQCDNASISDQIFTNNYEHIKCYAFQHLVISNNHLNSDETAMSGLFTVVWSGPGGVYAMAAINLQYQKHLLISDNLINRGISSYSAPPAIWLTNSLGGKIYIYHNNIKGDITTPLTNSTQGIKANGDLTNFEWVCNTFERWNVDVSYGGSGATTGDVRPGQIPTFFQVAGNVYSPTASSNIKNNSPDILNYDHFGPQPTSSGITVVDFHKSFVEPSCTLTCNDLGIIFDPQSLSINPSQNNLLNIFPNPATNVVYFELSGNGYIQSVFLYNLEGQLIRMIEHEHITTFDVSDLETGLYLISAQTDAGILKAKLLIQR